MQSTAETACRGMGFMSGFFGDEAVAAEVLPPWLSGIRCVGTEAEVSDCPTSVFGDTFSCGATQRLFCLSSRVILLNEAALTWPVVSMYVSSAPERATQRSAVQQSVVQYMM